MMFRKVHIENGIPVVMEPFKNVRSVSVGVWVTVGSRHEHTDKNGISHFLEHMFFKGTKKRSSRDIAVEIDSLGGDLNAFTSREYTAFYVKMIDEYLEKGMDLLSDIFVHSVFPEEDIAKEKKIIREEIKMIEDAPEDYVFDLFYQNVWGRAGLGQPIIGRRATVDSFTRSDLMSHIKNYYGIRDIIISCAGNFVPEKLTEMITKRFGGLRRGSEIQGNIPPVFRQKVKIYNKELSEAHICAGIPSLPQDSEDRYALSVLNSILGGGFSSRLFQNIREKRGLAYSVYSFTSSYADSGLWGVYAGVSKKKAREVVELMISEVVQLSSTITSAEVERAKKQLKGSLILGLESTNSRMNNIARQEIYFGRHITSGEIMRSIDKVTKKQITELAGRLISRDLFSVIACGDLKDDTLDGII